MRALALRWAVWLAALELAAWLLRNTQLFKINNHGLSVLVAAFVLALLNALVRPVLALFNLVMLPINILTMGLFALVVAFIMNAVLLWAVGQWIPDGFKVPSFLGALAAAAIVSPVTAILSAVVRERRRER
jgi:putative membrane protein